MDMISHGGLLWDPLGEITVRFSRKSFWRLMNSHVCLLWVSLCEITMRFFIKDSCDTYDFSRGIFADLPRWNHCAIFRKVFRQTYEFSRTSFVSLTWGCQFENKYYEMYALTFLIYYKIICFLWMIFYLYFYYMHNSSKIFVSAQSTNWYIHYAMLI